MIASGMDRGDERKRTKKRWEKARDIGLSEMRRGNRLETDVIDADEYVAIVYRYLRAATEATATLNLRILAKVMHGQILCQTVNVSEFLAYSDTVSTLSHERNRISRDANQIDASRA